MIINLLLVIIVIYHTTIVVNKTIKKRDTITLNNKNILINNNKVANIQLKFSNNYWSMIEYNFTKQKKQQLLIFADSCQKYSLPQINKNLIQQIGNASKL